MLIEKKEIKEVEGMSYIEAVFDSTNILKTTYFPQEERLYISFGRGQTYSYGRINEEVYERFEKAGSQGKFFVDEIKNNTEKHPFRKEFSLYPREIEEIRKIIIENKKKEGNCE